MLNNDCIQRFLFDDTNVKGQIIHLDNVLKQIYANHNYPLAIKKLLSEGLLCALLMSSTLKYKGQLTLQFQSKKALSLLLIKCNHLFEVRALAQFKPELDDDFYCQALNDGSLIVTIESDNVVKPYQSIVPLQGSIHKSIEHYFEQSEQLPTKFFLASTQNKAAGLMLQQMPTEPTNNSSIDNSWQHLLTLSNTIQQDELLTLDNETLLYRLFHKDKCRIFEANPVQFVCPCTKAKMLETIKLLGQEEAMAILSTHRAINVKCEFCLENYAFEKNDISYLFQQQ